jgi:hypothetical protein
VIGGVLPGVLRCWFSPGCEAVPRRGCSRSVGCHCNGRDFGPSSCRIPGPLGFLSSPRFIRVQGRRTEFWSFPPLFDCRNLVFDRLQIVRLRMKSIYTGGIRSQLFVKLSVVCCGLAVSRKAVSSVSMWGFASAFPCRCIGRWAFYRCCVCLMENL